MNVSALAQLRLANQQISSQKFSTPAALTSWMGGLQAQDFPAVRWALALRLKGKTTEASIQRAIARKAVLRTWCMRGTIHLVAPQDARWLISLTAERLVAVARPVEAALGLDETTVAKSNKLLARELQGGQAIERHTLYSLLEKAGISTRGQRGYHLLWRAGMAGLLCFGPATGKQTTFALLDEWAPATKALNREAAAAELARRYFRSRGPASSERLDLVERPGPGRGPRRPRRDSRRAGSGGRRRPELLDATAKGGIQRRRFFLLPGFDEFVLGYKDRSAVLDPRFASGIAYSNGIFFPTMVSKGRIVGIWKRSVKNGKVSLAAQPFEKLTSKEEGLFKQASRGYARFLGLELA